MTPTCFFCKQEPCSCIKDEAGRQIAPPEPPRDPAYAAHEESGRRSGCKHPEIKPGLLRPGSLKFAGIFQLGAARAV